MLFVAVIGAVSGGAWARAGVVGHPPRPRAPASNVVLGGSFQPIGVAGSFRASGDYVLVGTGLPFGPSPSWIVINTRLGTTTALDPQCLVTGVGPPWVLLSCPDSSDSSDQYKPYDVVLYSLTDGTQHTATLPPGVVPQCPAGGVEDECATADAVEADWIRWDASCYNCAVTSLFQNIQTGELRGDPTNATTFADLDSPALAHSTCPGVRLMRDPDSIGVAWGSVTFDGQFALVRAGNNVFLGRCGTRMRRLLVNGPVLAWNAGTVVWQGPTGQLNGLFLPSLQTFMIPLPPAIVRPPGSGENLPVDGLALTSGALYVSDGWTGAVWRTTLPTELPQNSSRPDLTRSDNTLTCRRGSWHNAVTFSYAWRVNGVAKKDAKPTLAMSKARQRRSVSCSVTASNAAGKTTATSAQLHVR
jgi:hypothetical protein